MRTNSETRTRFDRAAARAVRLPLVRILALATLVAAIGLLTGCSTATKLVLDDSWSLDEIRAGDLITTNLRDYLVVEFNAGDETATITVGPAWDKLSNVNVTGTFTFRVDPADRTIVLSRQGEDRYEITYTLGVDLQSMTWTRWVALGPSITIVGDNGPIEHITFQRGT